jgi:hypothetical protein
MMMDDLVVWQKHVPAAFKQHVSELLQIAQHVM